VTDLLEVNPLVEGEVIDFLEALRASDPSARRAALAVLKSLRANTANS
jgi:hypothetical protein